jgi:ElaB/YqjD/DUF883 family membrane-anchored ribosome-binding protein
VCVTAQELRLGTNVEVSSSNTAVRHLEIAVSETAETFGVKTIDRSSASREMYGEAMAAVDDAWHKARETAQSGRDFIRDIIDERPYTCLIAALGIGVLLGLARSR